MTNDQDTQRQHSVGAAFVDGRAAFAGRLFTHYISSHFCTQGWLFRFLFITESL